MLPAKSEHGITFPNFKTYFWRLETLNTISKHLVNKGNENRSITNIFGEN
jgi:hypothetical protein